MPGYADKGEHSARPRQSLEADIRAAAKAACRYRAAQADFRVQIYSPADLVGACRRLAGFSPSRCVQRKQRRSEMLAWTVCRTTWGSTTKLIPDIASLIRATAVQPGGERLSRVRSAVRLAVQYECIRISRPQTALTISTTISCPVVRSNVPFPRTNPNVKNDRLIAIMLVFSCRNLSTAFPPPWLRKS